MSALEGIPIGLLDPVSWRNKRCTITIAVMMNGSKK